MEKVLGELPDNSAIRLLKSKDKNLLEEYLKPHQSETMFICSNLQSAGVEYKGEYFEGEYLGYFNKEPDNKEKLLGIIVHYWNGNIMMHASNHLVLERLTTQLKKQVNRNIAGILGISDQASYVIKELELPNSIFSINRNESLYDLSLSNLSNVDLKINSNMIPAKEISNRILIKWMTDYEIEALGAIKNDALSERVNNKVERLKNGDCFILLQDNLPVSLVGFNSRLKDMLQVGPVWTPKEYRNKGFARKLITSALLKEKSNGIKKAVLFTDNPAAKKAYEAIGFKKIGIYRLALLKDPITFPSTL